MSNTPVFEQTIVTRCTCGRAYYDENYLNEPCRECGALIQ